MLIVYNLEAKNSKPRRHLIRGQRKIAFTRIERLCDTGDQTNKISKPMVKAYRSLALGFTLIELKRGGMVHLIGV